MEWAIHVTGAVPDLNEFSELQLYLTPSLFPVEAKKHLEQLAKGIRYLVSPFFPNP